MPALHAYCCSACETQFGSTWGNRPYVLDGAGRRVICPHPSELHTIATVLGVGVSELGGLLSPEIRRRLGVEEERYCLQCRERYCLDPRRDVDYCPHCGSFAGVVPRALLGECCPLCAGGTVVPVDTGIVS